MVNNDLRSLWEQRLADHATSGKSVASWCKEHSLSDNQFYYWRKKLQHVEQVKNGQPIKWLPLKVRDLTTSSISIRVGQATVDVKPGFDPLLLQQVIKTLQTI